MLGEQVGLQDCLFYEFNLEDRVPNDHLLRRLDAVMAARPIISPTGTVKRSRGCSGKRSAIT